MVRMMTSETRSPEWGGRAGRPGRFFSGAIRLLDRLSGLFSARQRKFRTASRTSGAQTARAHGMHCSRAAARNTAAVQHAGPPCVRRVAPGFPEASGLPSAAPDLRPPACPGTTCGTRLVRVAAICLALLLMLAASAQAQTEVPEDWALIPSGLSAGDSFRLLFLSSTKRKSGSGTISVYNTSSSGNKASTDRHHYEDSPSTTGPTRERGGQRQERVRHQRTQHRPDRQPPRHRQRPRRHRGVQHQQRIPRPRRGRRSCRQAQQLHNWLRTSL